MEIAQFVRGTQINTEIVLQVARVSALNAQDWAELENAYPELTETRTTGLRRSTLGVVIAPPMEVSRNLLDIIANSGQLPDGHRVGTYPLERWQNNTRTAVVVWQHAGYEAINIYRLQPEKPRSRVWRF